MLMFVDKGEGGVDENITDYVDMGRGLQQFDLFCYKILDIAHHLYST